MGNSPSSTNIQDSTVESAVNQSNKVANTSRASCANINAITNIQSAGAGAHQAINNEDIEMTTNTSCDNITKLVSRSSQTADQDLKQKLTQTATAAVKGVNLLSSPSANNTVKAHMKASINNINSVSQDCNITALGYNSVFNSQMAGADSTQLITNKGIKQESLTKASQNCGADTTNFQKASQKLSQTVSQTATATTTGVSLWELALLLLVRGMISIGFVWIISEKLGKIVGALFATFIIGLYVFYAIQWNEISNKTPDELLKDDSFLSYFNIYDKLKLKCNPDPCCHDRNESTCTPAAEEIKYPDTGSGAGACKWEGGKCIIKPGIPNYNPENDKGGVFLTQYSSVGSIDTDKSGNELLKKDDPTDAEIIQIRDIIARLGLQNKNLYSNNAAKGDEGDAIIPDSAYWVTKNVAVPQNPYEVGEFIKTDESIYGFEWIDYYVDKNGDVFKVPGGPLIILYTNLPDYFWNWDLLGESKCVNCTVTKDEDCGDCMGRVLQQSEQTASSTANIPNKARNPNYSSFVKENQMINYGRTAPPQTRLSCCSDNSCAASDKCYGINDIYIRCPDSAPVSGASTNISIHQVSDISDDTITWEEKPDAYTHPSHTSLGEVCDTQYSADASAISSSITIGSYSDSDTPPATPYINISESNYLSFVTTDATSNVAVETCKFVPYITNEGPPISVSKGDEINLTLGSDKWTATDAGNTYNCHALADGGCVKESLCKEFALAGKSTTQGQKIDLFKIVEEGGHDCITVALKDNITDTEWENCKSVCEIPNTVPGNESPSPLNWDGECIYNNSIRIQESILPEYPNTTGLKMFRDGSKMGDEDSYKDKIDIDFAVSSVIVVIVVIISIGSFFKKSGGGGGGDDS